MNMQPHKIESEIQLFCIRAKSFPEGILEAHQTLHSKVPFNINRKYFAASRPENEKIVYWAGIVELKKNEANNLGITEKLILKKGNYQSVIVKDYKNNIPEIAKVFLQLKNIPNIDPQGYCVEEILNNDLRCMVRVI